MPSVYPDPVRHLLCCQMFQCQAFTPILFDIYYIARCFNAKRLPRSCSTSIMLRDASMPSVYPDPVRHLLCCEMFQCQAVYPDPVRHLLCCDMFFNAKSLARSCSTSIMSRDVSTASVYRNPVRHLFCCEMFQRQAFTPILFDINYVARCFNAKRLPRSCSTSILLRDLLCCDMFQCQGFTPILLDIYYVARGFNAKRFPRSCSTSIMLREVSMPSVFPDLVRHLSCCEMFQRQAFTPPVRHLSCCEMFQCQAFTPILFDIHYVARCFNAKRLPRSCSTSIMLRVVSMPGDIYFVARCFNAKRLPRSCSTSLMLRDVSLPSVYPDPVRHLLCCEKFHCQAFTPILFDIYYVARCLNAKPLPRSCSTSILLRDVSMPKRLPGSCSTSIVLRDVSMPSVYPDPVRHLLCCEMFQCQAFTPILFDIYYVVRCFNAKRFTPFLFDI